MKSAVLIGVGLAMAACGATSGGSDDKQLYLDVHRLGAGNVTVEAVADAHAKDLAVQDEHGVSFTRYWVDERQGLVYCLAEAPDAEAVIATHREAHGLVPDEVIEVIEGR